MCKECNAKIYQILNEMDNGANEVLSIDNLIKQNIRHGNDEVDALIVKITKEVTQLMEAIVITSKFIDDNFNGLEAELLNNKLVDIAKKIEPIVDRIATATILSVMNS